MIQFKKRVEQGNSDSSIIVFTVQFYNNNHNSQFNHWIEFKIYIEFLEILFYVGVNFRSIRFQEGLAIYVITGCAKLLFTFFWLVDFLFGKDHFPIRLRYLVLRFMKWTCVLRDATIYFIMTKNELTYEGIIDLVLSSLYFSFANW